MRRKKRSDRFPFTSVYLLTDRGRQLVVKPTPIDEVIRRLHRFGSAPLLREKGSFIDGLKIAKPVKILARSFILLGEAEKEWLKFLANIYFASPVKIFGRKPNGLIEIRGCWQLARPDGWNEPDMRICDGHECFVFGFPMAYTQFYSNLSEKVKESMSKRNLSGKGLSFTN